MALFEQGDVEARQGGAGAVESAGETVFPLGILVAEAHAAGLVVTEARATGDFEVLAVAGCPNFDVVSFRGREADVAGAKLDGAVMQAEFL